MSMIHYATESMAYMVHFTRQLSCTAEHTGKPDDRQKKANRYIGSYPGKAVRVLAVKILIH